MAGPAVSDLPPDLEEIAQRLVTAFESGGFDGWRATFADDGVVWHSYDGVAKPVDGVAGFLRTMYAEMISEQRYDEVRRFAIDGGYVQQHTLRMFATSGASFEKGVAIVVHVAGGQVQRMDEYLDSSVYGFSGSVSGAA